MLLSLSELSKTKFGGSAHISSLLNEAIATARFRPELPYKDLIKYEYFILILDELNRGLFIRRLLPKDATASVFQHLTKCLGFSSPAAARLVNFNSKDTWYDTYSCLIEEFKNQNYELCASYPKALAFFSRKTLKQAIVAQSYAASESTCWNYFINACDLRNAEKRVTLVIRKVFKKFFIFIKENSYLFKNSTRVIFDKFALDKNAIF